MTTDIDDETLLLYYNRELTHLSGHVMQAVMTGRRFYVTNKELILRPNDEPADADIDLRKRLHYDLWVALGGHEAESYRHGAVWNVVDDLRRKGHIRNFADPPEAVTACWYRDIRTAFEIYGRLYGYHEECSPGQAVCQDYQTNALKLGHKVLRPIMKNQGWLLTSIMVQLSRLPDGEMLTCSDIREASRSSAKRAGFA